MLKNENRSDHALILGYTMLLKNQNQWVVHDSHEQGFRVPEFTTDLKEAYTNLYRERHGAGEEVRLAAVFLDEDEDLHEPFDSVEEAINDGMIQENFEESDTKINNGKTQILGYALLLYRGDWVSQGNETYNHLPKLIELDVVEKECERLRSLGERVRIVAVITDDDDCK
jgi:hypothetical protein